MNRHEASISILLIAVLLLTTACYWPSLSGPFLFDDLPNLSLIGRDGGLDKPGNFSRFVGGNESGPLGRPISMLSLAVHDSNWPTDPRPFRLTNLLVHLLCGLLVFVLSRQLFAQRLNLETADRLAITVMALWLLHPLLASTTAYIVQRMTQLATLFMLLGLVCYMHGRPLLATRPRRAWFWILGGMGVNGTLAVFSKEIGILLPLYALVIECVLFSKASDNMGTHRRALIAIFMIPVLAVIAYFAMGLIGASNELSNRTFTLTDRLFTQGLVLAKYLHLIIMPQLSGLGLIHDDFPVAHGLLDPPLTLFCFLMLFGLIVLAIHLRQRLPYFALGILWFFAGHSLEAGPVSLELYFEHRNYLPLLGLPIAVVGTWPQYSVNLQRITPYFLFAYLALAATATWQTAKLWGDERWLMHVIAVEHPHSLRAQTYMVNEYLMKGEREQAIKKLEVMSTQFPQNASVQLNLVFLKCYNGKLTETDIQNTVKHLQKVSYDNSLPEVIRKLIPLARRNACHVLQLEDIQEFIITLQNNPKANQRADMRGALHYYMAAVYQQQNKMGRAIQELEASYEARREHRIREQQIVWLLQYGRVDDAQYYHDLARRHHEPRPWLQQANTRRLEYLQSEIDRIRSILEQQDKP